MTREEKLWTMTGTTLLGVAEKLGIKTSKSTLKQGKEKLIAKILEAEHIVEETDKIEDAKEQEKKDVEAAEKETKQQIKEKESKLVSMPGAEKLADLKAEISAKPERKRGQLIEYNGKAQNICAWAKELGKSANTLYGRIYKLGWSVEKAFESK